MLEYMRRPDAGGNDVGFQVTIEEAELAISRIKRSLYAAETIPVLVCSDRSSSAAAQLSLGRGFLNASQGTGEINSAPQSVALDVYFLLPRNIAPGIRIFSHPINDYLGSGGKSTFVASEVLASCG